MVAKSTTQRSAPPESQSCWYSSSFVPTYAAVMALTTSPAPIQRKTRETNRVVPAAVVPATVVSTAVVSRVSVRSPCECSVSTA